MLKIIVNKSDKKVNFKQIATSTSGRSTAFVPQPMNRHTFMYVCLFNIKIQDKRLGVTLGETNDSSYIFLMSVINPIMDSLYHLHLNTTVC